MQIDFGLVWFSDIRLLIPLLLWLIHRYLSIYKYEINKL